MNIPKVMKGIELLGYGDSAQQRHSNAIPVPKPERGEVLIRVSAAGVNNTDINTRIGWYAKTDDLSNQGTWSGGAMDFPRIQGADVCGEIVAVGPQVESNRVGERVIIEPCLQESKGERLKTPWYFGSECNGGFSEYTCVAARHAWKVESSMSDVELASFPCSYSTAENMLIRSQVCSKDTVLISGASGGVGSAAVQLAKARGASVIGITSPSKNQQLLELGCDHVISRDADLIKQLGVNSVDVVIDLVAGKQWPQFLEVLRPGGRYAVSGAIGGPLVELDVRTLYLKDLSFFGCTVLGSGVFKSLIEHIEQGRITALVAKTFALHDINAAQAYFLEKQHVGKIVLEVGE
ncbi:alcohol dehydrogenase [Alginatibacterium sediminis]|uniref:Alcohol dehydrogenase n=1 Tax=Alginatibacterium sediminis TaxID=2164068 RepID=A0A420E7D6_9ALTE|nr:alcohol dehydrogenase family protein [Alginatibacterium sediminis]RKF14461.1 alcohol dehydrogenase [Alginatibacterium sediminis]